MSRLKGIRIAVLGSQSGSETGITAASDAAWSPVGAGSDHLLTELENLYWDGVRGELENIIRTLRTWQRPEFASVAADDEEDDFIHGFDTFLDQVSQQSRAFAIRYGLSNLVMVLSVC